MMLQKIKDKIPPLRLLAYGMLLSCLPLFFVILYFLSALGELQELENQLSLVQQQALEKEKKQAINTALRNHYRDADHFYIDKHLETLTFLEAEIESLQKISNNPNYPEDENIKKRLDYLSGSGNSMIFSEGVVQSFPLFQETTETLVHPVEINLYDLQQILTRIEGVEMKEFSVIANRPQLIILDFKLDKKNVTEKNEIYQLNLKLLKREFL